jgi:FlaA1/EpsC-like NDP-sugar epimerase
MDEALDFILGAAKTAKGSEIFLPKLRAYSIIDLKNALFELLGNTGEKIVGIRQGEKVHETLINSDEIRYSWQLSDKYLIANPFYEDKKIKKTYHGIKKITGMDRYSSDTVKKIPKNELKQIIKKSGLLDA